ncbi:MAG: sulfotransferase, partial [Pirellulales bacterium]|nr:sulfotransferase [Pirellulales bacterium]
MSQNSLEIHDATRRDASSELLQGQEIGEHAGVVHTDLSPVFILGHGSSGTSILARLLREEMGVAFGTESQFIIRYYHRLHLYGDLSAPENLHKLVSHLLTERWFERSAKFGFATDAEALIARVKTPTYAGVLDAIFSEFAAQVGMNRWGSKTPEYNLNLDVIGELFPHAKYIQMSRDGRDVYVSLTNRYWGPKNIHCSATEWKHEVQLVDRFLASVPADRKMATSYEELSDDPAGVFDRVIDFLKIDDAGGNVHQRIGERIRDKVRVGNYGKWKNQMTAAQIEHYERIACNEL